MLFSSPARVKKITKFKKNTLSLLVDRSMHFDFPERICMYQSLSLLKKKKKKRCHSSDPDQIRMEFRKECFVNLNIWACDRKHAKHQYCRTCKSRCAKYHFQHRCMTFFKITRDSYASASLSLSFSLSLPPAFKVC